MTRPAGRARRRKRVTEAKKETLLERALSMTPAVSARAQNVTDEEIELAVAAAMGRVTLASVAKVIGSSSANVAQWAFGRIRVGVERGIVIISNDKQ